MEIDCQFIPIYGKFVTSQPASFSRQDISITLAPTFRAQGWVFIAKLHPYGLLGEAHGDTTHMKLVS